jgi:hypothetical protein
LRTCAREGGEDRRRQKEETNKRGGAGVVQEDEEDEEEALCLFSHSALVSQRSWLCSAVWERLRQW